MKQLVSVAGMRYLHEAPGNASSSSSGAAHKLHITSFQRGFSGDDVVCLQLRLLL
ncbi:hypothetical protein E2C01_068886 [Portunus trituberculatus]|uniref:Uncharacterized protein n=1 Tax=Portunus trituberculatus TaxID=210409 RepID=A0A5B7HXR3_PORTR|nr:hypothetical protein [Portunus trituberculatus]